ncbi:MAG: hypothetical protein K9M07_00965 [Simkaniaceae bacterium]|nr:hypothetical protein [Simkaniaceae bacterium]
MALIKSWIALCCFIFSCASAEDNLILYVKAKTAFSSVYLSKLITHTTELPSDYLEQLYQVLYFDFDNNGYSEIKKGDAEIDKIITYKPHDIANNPPAKHTLRFELVGNIWKTTLFSLMMSLGEAMDDVFLTGSLHDDVHRIHLLADALHQKMYKTPGIASQKILYSHTDESNLDLAEVFLKYPDLLPASQLTHEKTLCLNPVILPSGSHFIFSCFKKGQPKLHVAKFDGSESRPFIQLRGNQLLPSTSSLGNLIAFISDASGHPDLFIQHLSKDLQAIGKPQQIYSHPTGVQSASSFSPDSSKLAFVSDQSGTPRIYILNLTETLKSRKCPQIECISNLNRENTSPSWSPDGKKLAYSAKTNGIRQIWIYDLAAKEEYQLTTGPGDKENPAWANNSLHLVYNTTSPNYDLYMINLNQIKSVQITFGPGIKHYPFWEQSSHRHFMRNL